MILPWRFKEDIRSADLKIITRVIINYNESSGDSITPRKVRLSTHSVSFPELDENGILRDEYYYPLILNIPNMKESIDIEKRNFKISNISLQVSNFEYNGLVFSDISKNNNLYNAEVDIYWQTQSAETEEDCLKI